MKTAILLFAALIFSAPASRAEAPAPQQWEYARLTFAFRDMLVPWFWKTSKADIREVNDRQLIQRLKGLPSEPEPKQYDLFDVIGEDGWELVGVSNTSAGTLYIFKRPVRPKP